MAAPDPTVAVITRTRNRPVLLDRAIRSVMQQSLGDLQLVVVNDGGEPGPVEEALRRRACAVQGRAIVVHRDRSSGMEAATNEGIRRSRSDYVAVLDDDDTWHPRFLELTVAAMRRSGRLGAVTATEIIIERVDESGIRRLGSTPFVTDTHLVREQPHAFGRGQDGRSERVVQLRRRRGPRTSLFSMMEANQFTTNAFVYSRSVLDEVGLYDESLPVLGDWDFNIRFLSHYDVERIDQPLAYYHHRVASSHELSNTVGHADHLHDRVREELLNRYLREDLRRGALGPGILANWLHERRADTAFAHAAYDDLRDDLADLVVASAPTGPIVTSIRDDLQFLGWRLGELDHHVSRAEGMVEEGFSASAAERRLRTVVRSIPRRAAQRGMHALRSSPRAGLGDGGDE